MAPLEAQSDRCRVSMVREWIGIMCKGDWAGLYVESALGTPGTDYFERPAGNPQIVLRLKRGHAYRAKVHEFENVTPDLHLYAAWPKGSSEPIFIGLSVKRLSDHSAVPSEQSVTEVKEFPMSPGERPHESDWLLAQRIETDTTYPGGEECEALVLNGWVRFHCHSTDTLGDYLLREETELGQKGEDYFVQTGMMPPKLTLDVRPQRGKTQSAVVMWRIAQRKHKLVVEWPIDADRPASIRLEKP